VMSREKGASSLKKKIAREGKNYELPLEQITDLAGVRVITYFPKDVDAILPILKKEFLVDEDNSVDKRQTANPSAFGYASVHLVVGLKEERAKLPEYALFKSLKCEIQVRTILQHAWAEIEHDIVYKSNEEIPFELRRKFASLAGLLEVADREFEMLRHQEAEIRRQIEKTIKDDRLDLPINLDSVASYLRHYHNDKKIEMQFVGDLVRFLTEHGVSTIQQLHVMLDKQSMAQAAKREAEFDKRCSQAKSCLLRYFLAIGKSFGLSETDIGKAMHCPALLGKDLDFYLRPKGHRNVSKVKPNKGVQSDGPAARR